MKIVPLTRAYAISIFIHIVVFGIFSVLHLNTKNQQKWHSFDWLSETNMGRVNTSAQYGENKGLKNLDSMVKNQPESGNASASKIESPFLESIENQEPAINPQRITGSISDKLKEAGSIGNPESKAYYSNMLEGDADVYFINETLPTIAPLINDSVVVEFSLYRDGKVNMNRVKVITYRRSEHWLSLKEAMQSWRFGFTGTYNAQRVYRIRCNFTLR
ncbi:MAG: hypothetical protein PHN71_03035 [Candidatus Cloacimonetes bacterium]|nr:hypothetical protein [Candidatus Cloacimonadota bacterium]